MSAPKPWLDRAPTANLRDDTGYGGRPVLPPPLPPRAPSYAQTFGGPQFGIGYGLPTFGRMYSSSYGLSPYGSSYDYRYGGAPDDSAFGPLQSVESVVRAVSSLATLLESTYQSMSMSFRAVLGVADNMGRLRQVVSDIFGSLAVLRTAIWFAKKLLYLLGLIRVDPSTERVWEAAQASSTGGRHWPIVALLGLMFGGPYVLYKLAPAQFTAPETKWDPKTDGVTCVALFDFETTRRGELPFRRGDVLIRQRTSSGGWARGLNRNGQIGLVPTDRLQPMRSEPSAPVQPQPPTD